MTCTYGVGRNKIREQAVTGFLLACSRFSLRKQTSSRRGGTKSNTTHDERAPTEAAGVGRTRGSLSENKGITTRKTSVITAMHAFTIVSVPENYGVTRAHKSAILSYRRVQRGQVAQRWVRHAKDIIVPASLPPRNRPRCRNANLESNKIRGEVVGWRYQNMYIQRMRAGRFHHHFFPSF